MHRLASCVLLAAAFAPAQADQNCADLCAQIAPAIKGSLKAGASVSLPKADVLARIAELAPGKARCDGAALFRVEHAWPEDDAIEGRLARVPVGDDSGRQVVLIAAKDRSCRGGAVLDAHGKLLAQWNAFASQCAGEILELLENGKAPAAAQVATARAAYAALQARAADLAPALGSGGKEYGELIKRALQALDGVAGDDTAQKRKERHKQLNGTCRDCHSLHGDKIDGDFEDFAANERLRLGLG